MAAHKIGLACWLGLMTLLWSLYPLLLSQSRGILILALLWFFLARQAQMGGNQALNFGRSRAKRVGENVTKVTFEDVAARDAYLPHPEHKKFGQLLGKLGVVADAFVVDYVPAPGP